MKHLIRHIILLCGLPLLLAGCMEWDYGDAVEDFNATGAGLFITNEGNFQYGNATLSYYDPETQQVQNEVFFRANGMKLGDVAQSMCIHDNKGWVVVNNSHVIFAIDLNTFKEVGRITNLTSPRYIHFLSDEKAYVTQLWDNRIFIINPKKYEITGYIQVPDMTMESGSTEQMVQYGKYVYCNCWSYQNRIIKIDTETDQVVEELKVGIQPTSLVMDKNHKMWTITDGGYEGSPYGYEAPSLYRIDAETFTVEKQFKFKMGGLAFGGAAQRYGRQALLDQQGHMVDGRGCGTCSRAPVPRIQRYDLLRPDRRPRAWRCLRGRCHRLPAAGHCLPLLVRR